MGVLDFIGVLRSRWVIICVTIAVAVLGAVAVNFLTTPLYQASTRLFVSTTSGASPGEIYQGGLFSQERVISYTKLLTGETLAQRTIDKLHLDMSADELRNRVKASSTADTVLIDVAVLDPSPIRARDIADVLSDEFVVMVSELETPGGEGRPAARVIVEQHASIPTKPEIPKTALILTVGLTLGVVFGIGLAAFCEWFDNTVKNRQILEEITGASLIATIPFDKDRQAETPISFATDRSAIAESFRELRTNLEFLDVDDPPRVIVVISSLPSEGKTTTAINVALALAEAEHNVVLVDGDMRRPSVDTHFGLIRQVGFSTVVSGRVGVPQALQSTRFPGLSVLTSGSIPPNPSELLGTKAAQKLLGELRGAFDYVIVDSSPLLAVTDAAVLAAASDGVLVIARFAKTKRDQLSHAVGNVENVGARILGAIFTMMPERAKESYRYSYEDNTHRRGKSPKRSSKFDK